MGEAGELLARLGSAEAANKAHRTKLRAATQARWRGAAAERAKAAKVGAHPKQRSSHPKQWSSPSAQKGGVAQGK